MDSDMEINICCFLINIIKYHQHYCPSDFWLQPGAFLLRSFLLSPHQGVQETVANALASFNVTYEITNAKRFEAVMPKDVIRFLVNLTHSSDKVVQTEAVRAIANLSYNSDMAEVVVGEGGVDVVSKIAKSANEKLLEFAVCGLWILSTNVHHQSAFANADGVQALVDIIANVSRSGGSESVMGQAIATLANLGGVRELVRVLETGIANGMQEQKLVKGVIQNTAIALWNFTTYNVQNVTRIIDEDGVPRLTHLCSSSISKFAGFMSVLTLSNMFDARLDELAVTGTSSERTISCARLENARRISSEAIQVFLKSCPDLRVVTTPASLFLPASTCIFIGSLCTTNIKKAGRIFCRESQIGTFLTMLRHSSPFLISCGAFALHQFTMPGGEYASHHVNLLQKAGAHQMLHLIEASEIAPPEAKALARIVLRNPEHYHVGHSK